MPIYAYRCATCGHAQDVLQKISDPPLTVCPACGAPTFVKQVTAAGFQLKGSGWYVTDFRDDKKAKSGDGDGRPTRATRPATRGAASAAEGARRRRAEAADRPAPRRRRQRRRRRRRPLQPHPRPAPAAKPDKGGT